jgi:large subunit ribosomal protein L31
LTRHPETHLVEAACTNCGTTFIVRTTASTLSLDVCSSCHPAFTGAADVAARGDRIERFNRRLRQATGAAASARS